ncbi:glycoside hydrolase family 88 protein [Sphingobacterium corticibacterium]|uniref:Glucuronyl hydrolase n=1 Tax=Sphingobacterium corticibacterium TaxID=2484746 RepID=A0A4Q6XDG9_9SPHI|nr:glycoside hydrolase family 88 protein [Sphingobacterium corticibacterium]RZF57458.1 glucuronyl hydrolase [Sphingobacterium corticibacterium]
MKIDKIWCLLVLGLASCGTPSTLDVEKELNYGVSQIEATLTAIPDGNPNIPRNIREDGKTWRYVDYKDWTSGFWAGQLWYAYEFDDKLELKEAAERFTSELKPLAYEPVIDHDLGFQIFNSFGHGYRLTGNESYKNVVLAAADSLATLYNPVVGTILSWPRSVPNMEWPQHNTIIDNMINLELLFWASKNGGADSLYDIALKHAETTMENHFRDDYTSYHAVVYDKDTGKRIKQVTHQGYADDSMWARGQSWAIYGYTMVYRETKDVRFLDFAQKVTDVYLEHLPEDLVPYWDFNAPDIPDAPRDASAAAVVASALLELSQYLPQDKQQLYRSKAEGMLKSLAKHYHAAPKNSALLGQSTGHYPAGTEINTSINYADYYYLEALLRQKNYSKDGYLARSND